MEVGASRKSVGLLAALVAVLAAVVYFQFLRQPAASGRPASRPPRTAAAGSPSAPPATAPSAARAPAQRTRFQPRLGRSADGDRPDPMTAEARLRTDLLQRVREIEAPQVERDIFNFGRPKPPPAAPPTPQEARQAQARLQAAMSRQQEAPPTRPRPAARPAAPRARPPQWKYYGLADQPGSAQKRAFLLDGEEILVAAEGSLLRERYRIDSIGPEAVVLHDRQANQDFRIGLEAPR